MKKLQLRDIPCLSPKLNRLRDHRPRCARNAITCLCIAQACAFQKKARRTLLSPILNRNGKVEFEWNLIQFANSASCVPACEAAVKWAIASALPGTATYAEMKRGICIRIPVAPPSSRIASSFPPCASMIERLMARATTVRRDSSAATASRRSSKTVTQAPLS